MAGRTMSAIQATGLLKSGEGRATGLSRLTLEEDKLATRGQPKR